MKNSVDRDQTAYCSVCKLLDSSELPQILVTFTAVIKPLLPNFLGHRYFKLRRAFLKFYRRPSALVDKYNVSLKTLLQQGKSEPEFYGNLVYRFRKNVGKSNFSEKFRKLINRYKRIIMRILLWILCGRLHVYLPIQSLSMAMLHSLIARRRFGSKTQ